MIIKLKCSNCNAMKEVGIIKKSDKVKCKECLTDIVATFFDIQRLKLSKQFMEDKSPEGVPFGILCKDCNHYGIPDVVKEKACCARCKKDLGLTRFFAHGVKEHKNEKNSKQT